MADIYCIPMMADNQKEPLEKHCFGDCGKISIGGMIDTGELAGPCWVCCEKDCPYEKGVVGPVGESEMTGDTIFIRAIQCAKSSEDEG